MKKTSLVMIVLAGLGLSALVACETGDTCDIKTSGIRVEFQAIEEGSSTLARAKFSYKNTGLELGNCGDTVEVNGVRLNSVGNEIPPVYEADVEPNSDGEFEFVFDREDEGPYTSVTGLPDPFEITAPASGDSFSRASDDIDVTWDNSDGDYMNVVVDAAELFSYDEDTSDTGSYTIEAGELDATSSSEDETFQADLILAREVDGTVDSIFDSGSSCSGMVTDTVTFTSTP